VWFVGVFGEDKRVHEAFSRRKKGDREREREREREKRGNVYGWDWLAQIFRRLRVVNHGSVTPSGVTVVDWTPVTDHSLPSDHK
jgi:hypothetical protein